MIIITRGVEQIYFIGLTVNSAIGNKVTVKYLQIKITGEGCLMMPCSGRCWDSVNSVVGVTCYGISGPNCGTIFIDSYKTWKSVIRIGLCVSCQFVSGREVQHTNGIPLISI